MDSSVLALVLALLTPACASPQQRSLGVKNLTFVLEVDPNAAQACGWVPAGGGDSTALAAKLVERRLRAMERAVRVSVGGERIEVAMPSIDSRDRDLCTDLFKSLGACEVLLVAAPEGAPGIDLAQETHKLEAWRAAHAGESLAVFDALDESSGGPAARLTWAESHLGDTPGPAQPLLLPASLDAAFGAGSFGHVYTSMDQFGYPALGVDLRPDRVEDFARVTESWVGRQLGVVSEGKLRSAPTLNTRLRSGFIIEGRFSQDEIAHMARLFQNASGPLRIVEVR